jgi:GntR family transcriptional regulator, transcriptional repressor for pyruvate dehydrogenase complex
MYKTFKARKLSDDVVDHLTELFISQQLKPGDRLPSERELAEQFGVSRTVVRESIKILEEKGMLDCRQGAGTYVLGITNQGIVESFTLYLQSDYNRYLELMEMRDILDVEVVGRLAKSASPEEIAVFRHHLDRMGELLDQPAEFAVEDVAFHLAFYHAMHNSVLMSIVQPILSLLETAMRITVDAPGSSERSYRRHVTLMECIEAHDSDAARRTMHEIIVHGRQRVVEVVRLRASANAELALSPKDVERRIEV